MRSFPVKARNWKSLDVYGQSAQYYIASILSNLGASQENEGNPLEYGIFFILRFEKFPCQKNKCPALNGDDTVNTVRENCNFWLWKVQEFQSKIFLGTDFVPQYKSVSVREVNSISIVGVVS